MIGETLDSCLQNEPRRLHELYSADKMAMLYKIILSEDVDEQESVRKMIHKLGEDAKLIIGE